MSETTTKDAGRDVKFWDCDSGREQLLHTEIGEAVCDWADDRRHKPMPETVEVVGFAYMDLPPAESIARDVLDRILEQIDEEYADPDGSGFTKPTAGMTAAAFELARVIRAEYKPWACEEVTRVTVRVADYVPASWMQPQSEASHV